MRIGFEWQSFHSQILDDSSLIWDWEQKLVLWATMPSPCVQIGALLDQLRSLCNLRADPIPAKLLPPSVKSLGSCRVPLALDQLYVGAGCKFFPVKPSPWLNPFSACPSGGLELYRAYVLCRPDFEYFLGHVARASSLVCDCSTEKCVCHAQVLIDLLPRVYNGHAKVMDESVFSCDEELPVCGECEDESMLEEDSNYEIGRWKGGDALHDLNETIRASAIGQRPKYPRVWTQLIQQIRSFQVLLFWEIFSGCAVLTDCMQECGWQCATPLDILYHPDFDLLNPLFFAIVIGLILEGRFALIHLAPPCSSFSMAVNRFYSCGINSV